MAIVGILTSVVALGIVLSVLRGFVLSQLWGWFLVPLGATAINIPLAIGIALIVGLLTHQTNDCQQYDEELAVKLAKSIGSGLVGPLAVWGIAAIVTMFL